MTTTNEYLIGNAIVITVNISINNSPTNVSNLKLQAESPGGNIRNYLLGDSSGVISNVSTGVYAATILLNIAGLWKFRWESTGATASAVEDTVICTPSII